MFMGLATGKELRKIMAEQLAQQAEIDALTKQLVDANTRSAKALGEITAAIEDLKAQIAAGIPPEQLDLTALDAAVDAATASAVSLDEVVPDGTSVPFEVPGEI